MPKVLISYYSRSGNTEAMAKEILKAFISYPIDVKIKKLQETTIEDLLEADGIIIGSPTYYGGMAGEVKVLFDKSVKIHGKLAGKVGGAFTSSHNIGGGNETTILSILQAMLIHGMVIIGDAEGDHYGPVAIGFPDSRAKEVCRNYVELFAKLLLKLFPKKEADL